MADSPFVPPAFLVDLLNARSPSGYESEAQAVFDRYVAPAAHLYEKDALGQRLATLNPAGRPALMLAGHMDELGLIVTYVDDKGFVYFDTIGGHDRVMIPGRRVTILTKDGPVAGVTGKRAVHLMDDEDRKKVPAIHEMWVDIAATSKADALSRVRIGDAVVHDVGFSLLRGSVGVARAFDNKTGAYVCGEALRRLAAEPAGLSARVVAVATTQEEIGCRGATTSAFAVAPQFSLTVDVGHATDHPDCDKRKYGETKLGAGPILCRGANISPVVFDLLVACAEREHIPYQLEADPRPTGTDARSIQIAREGVACGVISIPLRYMHTPSELVDLQDVENCVRLVTAFARALTPEISPAW